MKKIVLSAGILFAFLVIVSCTKEKEPTLNEELCSKNSHKTGSSGYFFTTDKDAQHWEATQYGVEYNEETGKFIIFADQFGDDLQTGNQIVLRFTSENGLNNYGDPNVQAEFNTIVGGDAGAIPYEIDGAYEDHFFEITNFNTENQVIEGQFSIRLKRKSAYDNYGYSEHISLTNGSFSLNYCMVCDSI